MTCSSAPLFKRAFADRHYVALTFQIGGLGFLQIFFEPVEASLGDAKVGENQLVLHRLGIARGIDRAGWRWDSWVLEVAEDVHQRICVFVRDHVHQSLRARRPAGHHEV